MDFVTLQTQVIQRTDEDATTPVFYTLDEIKAAINRAQRAFAFLTLCIERRDQALALGAGTTYYDVSSTFTDWLVPLRIKNSAGRRIIPVKQAELDMKHGSWESTAGAPTHYFMHGLYFLGIRPRPAAGGTSLSCTYAGEPTTLSSNSDTPEIPEEYHMCLVDYAVYRLRWKEGGIELANALELLKRFLAEAKRCGDWIRTRSLGQRYDRLPFDLGRFDASRLVKMIELARIPSMTGPLRPQNQAA